MKILSDALIIPFNNPKNFIDMTIMARKLAGMRMAARIINCNWILLIY